MPALAGSARAPLDRLGLANLSVVYLVWGSTFLAMRVGVRPGSGFGPWTFGGTRILVACLLLFAVAYLARKRVRIPRHDVIALMAAGALIWVGGHGLLLVAETQADSGYAALFIASFPLWTSLFDAVLDRRAPTPLLLVSLALGLAGIAVLSWPNLRSGAALPPRIMAALLIAPVTWAAGFTLQRRRVKGVAAFTGSAYQHLAAAPIFLLLAWLLGEPAPHPSDDALLAWGYLVVFGSLVAYSAAVHALQHLPARIAETYAYVNPLVAMVLGHLLLREAVGPYSIIGAGLVLLGVWGVYHAAPITQVDATKNERPKPSADASEPKGGRPSTRERDLSTRGERKRVISDGKTL